MNPKLFLTIGGVILVTFLILTPLPKAKAQEFCIFGNEEVKVKERSSIQGSIVSNGDIRINEGVSVVGNLLSSEGNVQIKEDVILEGDITAGGNVELKERSLIQGDVVSGGNVLLKEGVMVEGDVVAAGEVELRAGAVVGGVIVQNVNVAAIPPISPVTFSLTAGGADIEIGAGTTLDLTPGSYGELLGKAGVTLNLSSGQYAFDRFHIGEDSIVNFDLRGGTITIDVVGNLQLNEEVQMFSGGDVSDIVFRVQRKTKLKEGGQYLGIYQGLEDIKLKETSTLEGALVGQKVEVKENASVVCTLDQIAPL